MAFESGIIPGELQGNYFDDPILETPPSMGLLDLVQPSSLGAFSSPASSYDPIQAKADQFAAAPASPTALSSPTFFDWEGSRADRYVNSRHYKQLGFNPNLGVENEYKYGRAQTWGDVWGNGLTGMFKLAGNTFIEGWKGWGHMADSLTSWDSSKLVGSPEYLMEQDKITKDIMNKYAIFETPESEHGIFNRTFFGNMLQQSGFAVGAISQFLSEELLTMGMSTAFSVGKLGIKAPAWLGRTIKVSEVAADLKRLGDPIWKSRSLAQGFVNGARKLVPFADDIVKMQIYGKAGAGALQIASIGVGGVRRFLSEANMAMTEARMEAAGTYGELYTKLYDEELYKTGEAPDPMSLDRIKQTSLDAASDNFGINTGILMVMNRIQFDNMFSKFKFGRSVLGEAGGFVDDVVKVTGKTVGQKTAEQTTRLYSKGAFGTFSTLGKIATDFGGRKAAWEATKSVGRNIFKWEASEGIQELLQEGSNIALQDYYYDLYHGYKGGLEKSVMKGVESQANIQGLKTFLMGALTGRLLSPMNFAVGKAKLYGGTTAEQRAERRQSIEESVKQINAFYQNPNKFLPEHIANIKVQNKAAQNMEEAIANRDAYVFHNNKDSAFAKMISSSIKVGMFDSVLDTIRAYGDAFTDEEFKEAFGMEASDTNRASTKDFFNKIGDDVAEFHKTWKALKDKYGDYVKPELFEEGTEARKIALFAQRALDDALEMLATNDHKAKRTAVRAIGLQQKMAALPTIGSSAAYAFRVMGVGQNTEKEIALLEEEIKTLEATEKKDPATKQRLKIKKQQLKSLRDWKENSPSLKLMGRKEKRKFKKAARALENYLNSKNQESDIDVTLKEDELQEIYEDLVDYIELNTDNKDYVDAYNILANPMQFAALHKRLMSAMTETEKKMLLEHLMELSREAQGKPPIQQKDEPATHTILVQPDGKFSVVSPKGNVVAKDILTESEAKQMAAELDEILSKQQQSTPPPPGSPEGTSSGNPLQEKPSNMSPTGKVLEKSNGIFLIEDSDAEGNIFYYITDVSGNAFTGVMLDEDKYPMFDPNAAYDKLADAKYIYDAIVAELEKQNKEYTFDGKKIKAGVILVDDKGRKYRVATKEAPVKGKIEIVPLSGGLSSINIENLNGYRLESEIPEVAQPENPNAFRIVRTNELIKIYPHQRAGETREDAENRLKALIHNTAKAQLLNGISIVVTKNKDLRQPYFAKDKDGLNENRHLRVNPEPYMIQILYNGAPIGYMPYFNQYSYISDEGKATDLVAVNKEQFVKIFNPGRENLDKKFEDFKKNYNFSRTIHGLLINELKGQDQVAIENPRVLEILNIVPSSGEYAFQNNDDAKVSFEELDYNTVGGITYIIDKRTRYLGGGMYQEDEKFRIPGGLSAEEVQSLQKRINEARYNPDGSDKLALYGRYVGVVELPNGQIKFVEITNPPVNTEVMTNLIEKINNKSKELKENNLKEAVDEKTKQVYYESKDPLAANDINAEIDEAFYLAIPGVRGMRVNVALMPTGSLKVEFAIFNKGDKQPVKGTIFIKESETDSTKPLEIKSVSDLIERINNAITVYDENPYNAENKNKYHLKKINTTRSGRKLIDSNSFKRNLPESASIEEYRQMRASTERSVVKNPGLVFYPSKKNDTADSRTTGQTQTAPKPAEERVPTTEELENVEIPEDIQQAQSDLLKQRLEEQRKKKEQQEKKKDVAEQINDLEELRYKTQLAIEAELRAQGKLSPIEILKYDYNSDPRIQQILQKINDLNNGAAFKIADDLSDTDVQDINEFREWLKNNLPDFISDEELKDMSRRMKQQGVTVGMFYMHMNDIKKQLEGKIAINKQESKYLYHEAFHAVFRMLLSDEQIDRFLKSAKKELLQQGKSIAQLKKELYDSKPDFYSRFTDRELEERVYEEYLADKFDEWKRNVKTPTAVSHKGFFRKLLDLILNFFKSLRRTSDIETLFINIDKGAYKNSQVVSNRFTKGALIGVTEPALKSIQVGKRMIRNSDGEIEEIPIYLDQEEGNVLLSTIAAVYHRKMAEAGLRTHSDDVMYEVFLDYANLYNRTVNKYYESDEFVSNFTNSVEYTKTLEKVDQRYRIFSDAALRDKMIDALRDHLRILGYQEKLDEEEWDSIVDEYGDRSSTEYRKETYSIGGYGSLSRELRQYLATIVEEKADIFGNTVFVNEKGEKTGIPLIEAANANVLYNGILKAVEGSISEEQTLDRMRIFAKNNPEANKFWKRFSEDVGLIYDEDGNFVDISNKKQANLFQAVIKGFSQYSVDYFFINKDIKKKKTTVLEANRKGAAKNQFSIWYNAYLTLFSQEYQYIDRKEPGKLSAFMSKKTFHLQMLSNLLKTKFLKPEVLEKNIKEIVDGLKNELGISLSPLYIKYSYLSNLNAQELASVSPDDYRIIKAFEGAEPMTAEDADEIASVIKSGKNPFGSNLDPFKLIEADDQIKLIAAYESKDEPKETPTADAEQEEKDVDDDIDGAIGRLTRIAAGNAVFDEQVSTTSYKNASGELVYSHQLPTYNLVRTTELQNQKVREDLKKTPFLRTNFLLNNPFFESIANGLRILRIDGIKDSSLSEDDKGNLKEDKTRNVNQNKGVTYGDMSAREFLISLIELYGKNRKYETVIDGRRVPFMTSVNLLGVIEASNTGDAIELPVMKAVAFEKGKIVLTTEALDALYGEVMREYERITKVQTEVDGRSTPKEVIEGYHTGEMRGLKFIKTGNMLGTLAADLQESAKEGRQISEETKNAILNQIQEYWVGEATGKARQTIEVLKETGAIKQTPEGKLINSLLNGFVFKGFKDSSNKADVERNALLNMSTSSPEFNIAQILVNNFINTLSARQLYVGDAAENYKDDGGIDETKRNKPLNGSGPSSYSMITAPELGINHPNKVSHVVTFQDPKYRGKFAGKDKEKADAQMYMTVKALRYTLFGFGRLNQAQADLLDKIEKGQDVSVEDVFGEEYIDSKGVKRTKKNGSIHYNAQTNSIKLIYADGQKIVKTSGIILTKTLTSVKIDGQWQPRPGMQELDNLRMKLEDYEQKNQTVSFGIPKSASKGKKINIAENVASITDNNFVEHDNRFWRLQLENPSNKLEITDPTQAKQLIIAEQEDSLVVNYNGENKTIGEIIKEYLSDTEQRVKNNYFATRNQIFDIKEGFKELRKSLKQNNITPKLGKFLEQAVKTLESTGADPQVIEFFTPIKNKNTGELEQKFDLNHPITLDKFTQLFLAYFSKGVMSEKSPGHSLALVSNWGMKVVKRVIELDENGQPKRWEVITRAQYENDRELYNEALIAKTFNNDLDREFEGLNVGDLYIDDLRHNVPEYNEKGEIIGYFTEFMMPPHYREFMVEYERTGKIPKALLEAFGVRIPSQDKHSFTTLKAVDLLPAHYGSVGVFPHELIEISGADFDIDKLYMQVLDTYKKNGRRVAYGTEKSKNGRFAEYIMYLSKKDKVFKEKLAELKNITINYNEDKDVYDVQGELEPVTVYDNLEDLMHDLFSSKESFRNMLEVLALKELNLPSTPEEYEEYVKKYGEQNNGVLNNNILRAKIKLFNNENMVTLQKGETVPKAFQVAETTPLLNMIEEFKREFPILNDILEEGKEDVDSIIGMYKAFKNNKEGARNIGPAVNSMLVYALFNAFKVEVRKKNMEGKDLFVLNIDGKDFDRYGESRAWDDATQNYTGERIFYNISAIVSAMTDNAKERLAARLGLNLNAIDVVSNMVALGVPLETALIFNLQPAVREFYKALSVTNNSIKTNEELNIYKSSVGNNMLKDLAKMRSKKKEDRVDYPITTDLLKNNIKSNGGDPDVNYSIFKSFLDFYNQTKSFSTVAGILKMTKGLGTSNEDINAIDEKEESLGLDLSDAEFAKSSIPFDLRQVLKGIDPSKPHHNITANYIKIKDQIKELQKSIMLERSYFFKRLKETVLANLNVHSKESERFNTDLKRDIIAYLGIKAYMHTLRQEGKAEKLAGMDNALIYDAEAVQRPEDFKDIIDTVLELRKLTDNKNYFVTDFLNIVPVLVKDLAEDKTYVNPRGKSGINTVQVNTWAKLGAFEVRRIQDSILDLYSNLKTRKHLFTLFNYLLVKDGGKFKNASFIRFMPPAMFKDLLDATGRAGQLLKFDEKISSPAEYMEVFGMTPLQMFNEFTNLYSTNVQSKFNIPIIRTTATVSEDSQVTKPANYTPEVIVYDREKVNVDMFGGIRKKELTLLTDEMGNEFYAETVKSGSFDQAENEKLGFNRELLKAKGFNVISKIGEDGKTKYFIELPYVIKINFAPKGDVLGVKDDFVYYKLSVMGKEKEDQKSPGIGNFIMEIGDNMALGTTAFYQKFDPVGSKDQWKLGGVTGPQPTEIVIRERYGKNKKKYDDIDIPDFESQIEMIEAQLAGVNPLLISEPVQDLYQEFGISTSIVGNKVTYYRRQGGKDIPYDPGTATSPEELLANLKMFRRDMGEVEQPINPDAGKETKPAPPSAETGDVDVVIEEGMGVSKNKFKDLIKGKKGLSKEIEERKKEDDNNCEIP